TADVHPREVVGDGIGPAATRVAPFPREIRVEEDAVSRTDDGLVRQAVRQSNPWREIAIARIGNLRPHVRWLVSDRVRGRPEELASEHIKAAQAPSNMVRPLVVLPAEA